MILVKWLGFNDEENSWINKKTLIIMKKIFYYFVFFIES